MLQIARKRIRHKPGNRVVLALNKKFNTVQKLALPSHTEVASSDVSTNTTMTTYLSSQSTETSTTKIKSVTESGEAMSNCHSKDLNHSNHEFENFKKEIEIKGCDVNSKTFNEITNDGKGSSNSQTLTSLPKNEKFKSSLKLDSNKSPTNSKKNRLKNVTYGSCIISRESLESKREKKAAKTLAIITGTFVICWLPFFILALIRPLFIEIFQVPQIVSSIFLWLGYVNSILNPVIYTIFSADFRIAFRKILFGKKVAQRKGFRI